MIYASIAVLTVFTLMLVICCWANVCSHRTYERRDQMVKKIYSGSNNWRVLSREFRAVSYERHMHALMLFRDPMNLYSEEMQSLMKEPT